MLSLPASVRVYVASQPVDLRKGFDRLAALARSVVRADPLSGHLFVFRNRRGNAVKVLWWDRTGYALLHKRLERGSFRLAEAPRPGAAHVEVDAVELALMLEGIDLSKAQRRTRWRRRPCDVATT
jgi:transposase